MCSFVYSGVTIPVAQLAAKFLTSFLVGSVELCVLKVKNFLCEQTERLAHSGVAQDNSREDYPMFTCVQRQSASLVSVKVGDISGLSEEVSELFKAASSLPKCNQLPKKKEKHLRCLSNSISSCTVVVTSADEIW